MLIGVITDAACVGCASAHSLYAVCKAHDHDDAQVCTFFFFQAHPLIFSLASCSYALLTSPESQYVTKQVLVGGKGTESDGKPRACGQHQEGYFVCREMFCSKAHPETEAWASRVIYICTELAGWLSPQYLPS